MWATKNGVSKDFYNPEELRLFLDSFQHQPMDSTTTTRPRDASGDDEDSDISPPELEKESMVRYDTDNCPRGRDLERLAKSHDDRETYPRRADPEIVKRGRTRSNLKRDAEAECFRVT
ncbi:hypothetical protein NDU88_008285 [Pleurodeles waltl]|uniref:Uncharacterized protein n=1 Tax=Pleurodeles waltl TaxID=8319 RepID=A0AAV7QN30_PLEWA|nr:hypothetical protein NDU88_008285 [Pleurodeles waltl]